jgi:para-aminobenzoate synthetase component 1
MDSVEGKKKIRHLRGNPLVVLSRLLKQRAVATGSPMVPFAGGAVGYFGYGLGRFTTEREARRTDDLGLPEMHVGFYNSILAYEHRTGRWYGAGVDLTGGRGATIRKRLGKEIDKLCEAVTHQTRGPAGTVITADPGEETDAASPPAHPGRRIVIDGVEAVSTMTRDEYCDAVRTIKDHIAAGDIYQANLTQRWSIPFTSDPGLLYRALRSVSPAPFGIYLNTGECVIAGSSPESFLSVRGRTVETRPIKGTRPRGDSPEDDARLRRELEHSEKDRAELTMIADLERNDLGKICTPGSVEVEELYRQETFSNVHHLVSVVRGELRPDVDFEQIMNATFPGGSITGAPKLRAMEILDEVEKTARGPYTGAMGYLGLDGSMELNVAIRTLVMTQGQCHLGVGSGIVADSDPDAEYEECLAKARDMLQAIRKVGSEHGAAVPS